jgi:MATE family multidrug resistance protein
MNKEILRLAFPNIISNISVPLISSVDTILMGSLSGMHIGAVGIGSMIFNFVYWNFGFLRMGTTGITAQAYGQEDNSSIINTLGRALLIATILAILILVLQKPLEQIALVAMNVSTEQAELVKTYFYIRIWGAPAALGMYAMLGWFFGMQNSVYPLILTILINVINIVLSWYLVAYQGLEAAGVAYGTVAAQYTGLFAAIGLFYYKYSYLIVDFKREVLLKSEELKKFLRINRDIFIRTVALTLTFSFFYSKSSENGELILAANTILMQFFNWMAYGVDGFAFAAESLVGKYKGKSDAEGTRRAVNYSYVWGMGFALIYAIGFFVFGKQLLLLFTDQSDVIQTAIPYLLWIVGIPIIATPSFIWDGIFVGLTASASMRNSMILATLGFFAAFYWLEPLYGNHGLWAAMYIYMLLRGLVQQIMYSRKGINLV